MGDNSGPNRLSVTVREAAELTGLGRNTVHELISGGELASVKIGRRRLIPYAALEALIARGVDETPRQKRRPSCAA